ncbi:MAG: hypothetical protein K0R02_276 [Rickettsiaceae bacterium]|jgi:outer membrane autotransporter protein|nr:hypothetical protein [Rickettsiaceae bacterium]
MTKKPSLLKTMLATASTVAVLASGSAFADQNINADPSDSTGTGLSTGAVSNSETLTYTSASTFEFKAAKTGVAFDNSGAYAAKIKVSADGVTLGALTGTIAELDVNVAGSVTLTDDTATTITATKLSNATAELIVAANDLTLTGTINANGGAFGTVTVTGEDVTFASILGGGTAFKTLSLANAAGETTFQSAVTTATSVTVDAVGSSTFSGALTTTTLDYQAAGTVNLNAGATAAVTFNDNDGVLVLASGQTLTGAITADHGFGIVEATPAAAATTTIASAIGTSTAVRVKEVNNAGAGTLALGGATVYAQTINLEHVSSVLDLTAAATVMADIKATNATNSNVVKISHNITFEGNIGTSGIGLEAVQFGDKTLTINDGSTVYAPFTNGTGTDGKGKLIIAGDFEAKQIGTNSAKLEYVELSTDDKTTTFTEAVFTKDLNLSADAIAVFNDGVDVAASNNGIDNTGVANEGTLTFKGDSNVTGKIGETAAFKLITLDGAGKTVYVTGTIDSETVKFNADAVLKIADNLTAAVTTATNNTGTIAVTDSKTIAGDIGADGKALKAVYLGANETLTINNLATAVKAYTNFTTYEDKKATLVFSGAGGHTVTGDIGASGTAFEVVKAGVAANSTFNGDVYTETFTVEGANTITVAGILSGTTFNFGAHAATLALGDGATVDMLVKNTANDGMVTFAGGGTISKDLGETGTVLDSITFAGTSGDDIINVGADMYATNITTGANIVNVTTDVTFGAAATTLDLSGTTLKLNKNTLTLKTLAAAPIFNANSVVDIAVTGSDNGKIDNSANTTQAYNFSNAVLNISSASGVKDGVSFVVYEGGVAPAATFAEVTADGRFFKYASAKNADDFTIQVTPTQMLKFEDDIRSVANVTAQDLQVAKDLGDAAAGATGNAELEIGAIYDSANSTEAAQIIKKIAPNASTTNAVTATATHVAMDVTTHASNEVASRVVSLNTGAAAGEAGSALGAWVKGFFAKATEKTKGNGSGYKADINGGTLGFDMNANDATVVGFAASLANTNAKFKNAKAGDKLEGKSMLFNVYGMYDCGDDKFVQAGVNFGNTNVKARTKRNFGTAIGKFDVMNYGVNVMGGMNYKAAESFVITPMAGLTYGKFLSGGYTETGAGASNQTHAKKNFDKLVGTLGLRFTSQIDAGGDMKITPEAHGFINHDFRNKGMKDTFTIDGLGKDITVKGTKQSATSYNVGLSLTAKSGNMEYGVGYDADLKTKYVSHQGSVKVRVNF